MSPKQVAVGSADVGRPLARAAAARDASITVEVVIERVRRFRM
jgi:hypothetical protein